MARDRLAYGSRSLAALGAMLVLTQDFHPIMLLPLHLGQTGAWIVALSAGVLVFLLMWPVYAVLKRLPRGTLVDLAQTALGRPGAVITVLLITGALCFTSGLVLRETSEMAISAGFPHTPQTFATTSILVGSILVAYGDASSIVRLGRLLFPLVVLGIVTVLVGTVGWGEFRYLLPIWGPGPIVLAAAVPPVTVLYTPLVIILLQTDRLKNGHRSGSAPLLVPLGCGVVLALTKVVHMMTFAFPLGRSIAFPMHGSARLILGGRFLERLEGFWMFIWVVATIVFLGATMHACAVAFARAVRLPRHTTTVPALAVIVLTLAFFPPDQATTILWHERCAVWVSAVLLLFPAGLAAVAALRMRGRQA